jgi:hypothetical protein
VISARCELRLAEVHPDLIRVVRRAAGRKPFLDGPHFELPAAVYP